MSPKTTSRSGSGRCLRDLRAAVSRPLRNRYLFMRARHRLAPTGSSWMGTTARSSHN